MKTLICCNSFYEDIDIISSLIKAMQYENTIRGAEIPNFSYMPTGVVDLFDSVLNVPIEIQGGIFKKPSGSVLFDEFYQHSLWTCIVALEDTKLNICEKDGIKTFFDANEQYKETLLLDKENEWSITSTLAISKNNYVFIRPWIWYSLQENSVVQTFLINQKIIDN